jgi:hypothetical protein
VAGVIEAVGTGVTDLHVGEPVFSLIGRTVPGLNGGYAEYVVAPAENVVRKPKRLTYAEAAGVGVAGRTAERSVEQAQLHRGQRVLITGDRGRRGQRDGADCQGARRLRARHRPAGARCIPEDPSASTRSSITSNRIGPIRRRTSTS